MTSVSLAPNKLGYKQSKLSLEQLKIFDTSIVGDTEIIRLLEKDVSKIVSKITILEEFVNSNKVITHKNILSSIKIFNFCFVDKIKDPYTNKDYKKNNPIEQAYNDKNKNLLLTQSPIIQRTYIVYQNFYI